VAFSDGLAAPTRSNHWFQVSLLPFITCFSRVTLAGMPEWSKVRTRTDPNRIDDSVFLLRWWILTPEYRTRSVGTAKQVKVSARNTVLDNWLCQMCSWDHNTPKLNQWQSLRFSEKSLNLSQYTSDFFQWCYIEFSEFSVNLRDSYWFWSRVAFKSGDFYFYFEIICVGNSLKPGKFPHITSLKKARNIYKRRRINCLSAKNYSRKYIYGPYVKRTAFQHL